jgi:predicted O-methyltransferase YrrM
MDDATNLNPPAVVRDLERAAQALGFTMSSDLLTGSLLRTLAASKPSGDILELGTGVGMGTAWLLAGMDAATRLTSVDRNEETTAVAEKALGSDQRVLFMLMDGIAFIRACHAQRRKFDLIFADTYPGKFEALDDTLALLKRGGLYVIDDLNSQPDWAADHEPRVEQLIRALDQRDDLHITKLNWSSGLLIAARK